MNVFGLWEEAVEPGQYRTRDLLLENNPIYCSTLSMVPSVIWFLHRRTVFYYFFYIMMINEMTIMDV